MHPSSLPEALRGLAWLAPDAAMNALDESSRALVERLLVEHRQRLALAVPAGRALLPGLESLRFERSFVRFVQAYTEAWEQAMASPLDLADTAWCAAIEQAMVSSSSGSSMTALDAVDRRSQGWTRDLAPFAMLLVKRFSKVSGGRWRFELR
jgi:hypothetical protein